MGIERDGAPRGEQLVFRPAPPSIQVGQPSVIFLDEPSTGLDPMSKRQLWQAIQVARRTSAIVLTTHYMDEAEHLCDRLGIFVRGALVCIGSPQVRVGHWGLGLQPVLLQNCSGAGLGTG